jgi:hypothetical protein
MPENIPEPLESKIFIDAKGKKIQEIIYEIVFKTYNIMEDDTRFRKSIRSFEEQREQYPPRREYGAYTIQILNDRVGAQSVLREMGFNIQKIS